MSPKNASNGSGLPGRKSRIFTRHKMLLRKRLRKRLRKGMRSLSIRDRNSSSLRWTCSGNEQNFIHWRHITWYWKVKKSLWLVLRPIDSSLVFLFVSLSVHGSLGGLVKDRLNDIRHAFWDRWELVHGLFFPFDLRHAIRQYTFNYDELFLLTSFTFNNTCLFRVLVTLFTLVITFSMDYEYFVNHLDPSIHRIEHQVPVNLNRLDYES